MFCQMIFRIAFLSLLSLYISAQTYTGIVIRVIDGDTFVFQTDEGSVKVRMFGIDAPEKDQPFGAQSTAFLERYLKIPATIKTQGVDQYGRTLGILFVDHKNINLEMVRSGNAWHFKKYSKDQTMASAEDSAKIQKLGLWKDPFPMAPWDWRHK
jgi:micrococcal nuclease